MNLQRIIYLSFFMGFSCIKPTLLEKDCAGVIGGYAVEDKCGVCDGPGLMGCDSTCGSTLQLDCAGDCGGNNIVGCDGVCIDKYLAKQFDYCGICDGDNSSCSGCTDPNAICDSYDEDATIYEEGGCVSSRYYCEIVDNELDITSQTQDSSCVSFSAENDCGPGTNLCKLFDCANPDYEINSTQSLACNVDLIAHEAWVDNDTCDYYGVLENVLYNYTSCPEFGYDGGTPEANFTDGDCNLVDCRGVHFSNDLCEEIFVATDIDTLTNPPDTTIETTIIKGCINGVNKILTTSSSGISNSIRVIGSTGWLDDGECDSEGFLFENYGLDFNCIEHDYEGGDCVNSSGRTKSHNQYLIESNLNSLLISKRKEKIKNIINKRRH